MLVYFIIGIVAFVAGYLVGANNPLASVKAKIAAAAKAEAAKL